MNDPILFPFNFAREYHCRLSIPKWDEVLIGLLIYIKIQQQLSVRTEKTSRHRGAKKYSNVDRLVMEFLMSDSYIMP